MHTAWVLQVPFRGALEERSRLVEVTGLPENVAEGRGGQDGVLVIRAEAPDADLARRLANTLANIHIAHEFSRKSEDADRRMNLTVSVDQPAIQRHIQLADQRQLAGVLARLVEEALVLDPAALVLGLHRAEHASALADPVELFDHRLRDEVGELLRDVAIAGPNRPYLAALVFPNLDELRRRAAAPRQPAIDRQIVLVDALGAIHAGPQAVEDMRRAMAEILGAFRPGRNAFLSQLFMGRRVEKILFAATKADQPGALPVDVLRTALDLPPDRPLYPCVAVDPDSARGVVMALLHILIDAIEAAEKARLQQDSTD